MKRRDLALLSALVVIVVGCGFFGRKARNDALLPALREAAVGLREDAMAGVAAREPLARAQAETQVDAFFSVFESSPMPLTALALWAPVKELCDEGIDARVAAGTIGTHVAMSLRERAERFESGLKSYLGGF